MNYRYVIWDVDGTLMDAGEGVILSIQEVLYNHGFMNFTHEQLVAMHAEPLIQNAFQKACLLTEGEAAEYADEFREIYKSKNLYKAELYPGIEGVMARIKELGLVQAVATNKRQDYAYDVCAHFGITQYCTPIVGSDGKPGKSKIHVLERCIETLAVEDRSEVVMIGDTEGDKRAAQEAGVAFIGVNYGYGFRGVEMYADTPEEILTQLLKK